MASLLPEGKQSFTKSDGTPLVGGKLYTYAAGTSTPKATYADAAETVPNTNPVILDSRGEATVFWRGAYKIVLKDASDATIWSVDNAEERGAKIDSVVQFCEYLQQASDTKGAETVGFIQHGSGAVPLTVQSELRSVVQAKQFGAKGDGITDDTAAFNAAITSLGSAGGVVRATPGAVHYIAQANGILVPSNVILDLQGATLKGTGNSSSANTLINSAYYNAGVLTVNTLSNAVVGAQVKNGTLYQAAYAMQIRYCIDGCAFENIQIAQCYNGIYAQFCLYARFENIMARNTSLGTAYRFSNNCNAITLKNVFAVGTNPGTWAIGFRFDAKTYAVKMLNCSSEYCLTGIQTEEVHGLDIDGHYFEVCATYGINLNTSAYRKIGVRVSSCFFSEVPHLVYGKTVNNFVWEASNDRASSCTPGDIVLPNDTAIATGSLEACTGVIRLNSTDLLNVLPTGVTTPSYLTLSDAMEIQAVYADTRNGGFGTPIYSKARMNTGVVPLDYNGYTDSLAGEVPFCSVVIPIGASVTATITTGIQLSQAMFTIFSLNLVDAGVNYLWQGRAYNNNIYLDFNPGASRLLSIANVGGYMQLQISSVSNAGGTATITGQVRIV